MKNIINCTCRHSFKKQFQVQLAQYELMDQLNHFENSQHSDLRS